MEKRDAGERGVTLPGHNLFTIKSRVYRAGIYGVYRGNSDTHHPASSAEDSPRTCFNIFAIRLITPRDTRNPRDAARRGPPVTAQKYLNIVASLSNCMGNKLKSRRVENGLQPTD